jgi:thioredoxin reductase (NADPH)
MSPHWKDDSAAGAGPSPKLWDAVIVGGGIAGLSAAVYLGRSRRKALLVDGGESMARWEPLVENYLGFPEGLSGKTLLERGRAQVKKFGVCTANDRIVRILREGDTFLLEGGSVVYRSSRVLLATGLTHLLPDIPGADKCLGNSVLFCKDCDAFRVRGKRIAIYGRRNEAARYALAMLAFSPTVTILTDGREPTWDCVWQEALDEYRVHVYRDSVKKLEHEGGRLGAVLFQDSRLPVDALFATRGDVYHTGLAEGLGADQDAEGQLIVDGDMRTTVPGLYAAGCVTPANCQMIIAAGQGAAAAQAIDHDLLDETLRRHQLPREGASRDETQGALN